MNAEQKQASGNMTRARNVQLIMNWTLQTLALVVASGVAASGAFAQVRASLPTPSTFNKPRSFPMPAPVVSVPNSPAQPASNGGIVFRPGSSHRPGVVVSGSGLTVNGSFSDDNFNIAFNIGGTDLISRHEHRHDQVYVYPYHPYYNYRYSYGYYPYGYDDSFPLGYRFIGSTYYPYYVYDGYQQPRAIDGSFAAYYPLVVNPTAQQAAPPTKPELTPTEQAEADMNAGDYAAAREGYAKIVQESLDDHESMRRYALSLMLDKQVADGVAVMAMAYRNDPTLASRAFDPELLGSDGEWRKGVRIATTYANRSQTGASWLTVAVLMQAEGRAELAAKMIEKAQAVGVETAVYDAMLAALK